MTSQAEGVGAGRSSMRESLGNPQTNENEDIETPQGLAAWVTRDPEGAFNNIANRFHALKEQNEKEKFQLQHDMQQAAEEMIQRYESSMETLQAEYHATKERLQALIAGQNQNSAVDQLAQHMQALITTMNNNQAVSTTANRRSAKIPDPPMLDDSKDLDFDVWRAQIESKLVGNADHYPTARLRVDYVATRCEGKARKHIGPRLRKGSTNLYADEAAILDHLEEIFSDPNRRTKARQDYQNLAMGNKDSFEDFLIEFVRLAEESDAPVSIRKEDLYNKLPYLLQNQVMSLVHNKETTFKNFTDRCRESSLLIHQQQANRTQRRAAGGAATEPTRRSLTTNQTGSRASTPARSTGTSIKREPLTPTERLTLMKEGKCFNCRTTGHLSRDCPQKQNPRTPSTIVATTDTHELDTMKEDVEEVPRTDGPGKASA